MPDRHVKYRGMIRELQGIMDGLAILDNDEPADPHELQHPSYHPTLGLTAARTAAADSGGVMVALRPPDGLLRDLVATGVVTEDFSILHVTLAYFNPPPSPDALHEVMRRWTTVVDPITLRLGGWGKFTPPGSEEVLYASIDSPGIERWRNSLLAICRQEGLQWREDHGFQPHLTVAYAPEVTVPDTPPPSQEVTVDTVVTTEGPTWTTWLVGQQDMGLAASRTAASQQDWETLLADVKHIYRGFGVQVTEEQYEYLCDEDISRIERAELVLELVTQRNVGRHWSAYRNEAAGFAGYSASRGDIRVLLTAEAPTPEQVEYVSGLYIEPFRADGLGEQEVPIRPGEHLNLTKVEWAPGGPQPMLRNEDGGGWLGHAKIRTIVASLHDGPEPALPRTDGDEGDEGVDDDEDDMSLISQAAQIHLQRKQANARATKQALRDFTLAEQQELIDEGAGRLRARNLSALDLAGTHYDPSVLDEDPEDLFG